MNESKISEAVADFPLFRKLMLRQITRRIEDELGFHEWIPVPE